VLVQPDGSYPVAPLAKPVIVVKVVQNAPLSTCRRRLRSRRVSRPTSSAWRTGSTKACSKGKKPDFILFNEFPLTGYSAGSRNEKLKFTIQVPGRRPSASANSPRPATPT
jgi:hypothetical protein